MVSAKDAIIWATGNHGQIAEIERSEGQTNGDGRNKDASTPIIGRLPYSKNQSRGMGCTWANDVKISTMRDKRALYTTN